ncbi:hypothetical protein HFP51_09695 [Parasphingopyxis sp. CP4]|uniref:hypothetical protein n=1 Tax=Parasphingopyxis sp. CP4 TaxID=2724527 RepID=UPI0015A32C46|nr:hypothetical protein [Parasphingopyxis sp. CP4]QLC22427.1 hypothetical protein HFP51_09695 [Parasphingopyxis sp. CP4]
MKKLIPFTAAAILAGMPLSQAAAQAQRDCNFTFFSGSANIIFDPFGQVTGNQLQVNIDVTRNNDAGGAKASDVDFYLRTTDPDLVGVQVVPISAVGSGSGEGYGVDIHYDQNESPPLLQKPIQTNQPVTPGALRWRYTGNNVASDTFTIIANVIIPPGADFDSTQTFTFTPEGVCNGTGGGQPFTGDIIVNGGINLNIIVLSALRATYVGPALDFGEVGDVDDTAALSLTRAGNIRVESSDVYEVSMTSQNNYRMTYPTGNPALPDQNLEYQVSFLGRTRNPTNTSAINVNCSRAGIGTGSLVPVSVSLLEGGLDEAPSPDYQDFLLVTFTPRVNLSPTETCGA